ncbi:MAG TPA: periplasmic heavy metal sensor [Caulobacteraceae bacterium]|jgi:uncharacterized membrane protein|nr:periplasmic heavy metal sensor [Caulobacteraceae bacterium]
MRPRWLVIGLVASLALNLFLIGAGAGVIALGVRMARQQATTPRQVGVLFWATEDLPQPDRRAMRMMLRDLRDELKTQTDRSVALRIAAWDALANPKPDTAAIDQNLAESRQIDIAARARVEQAVVNYALRMPPAERATLAAGMRRLLNPRSQPTAAAPTNAAVRG